MRRSEKGELAGERELDGTGAHIFEKAVNRVQRFSQRIGERRNRLQAMRAGKKSSPAQMRTEGP